MNTFSLKNEIPSYTVISNFFIDTIMPEVNGEYLKVYLLLLRYAGSGSFMLSLSQVADVLDITEKDVRRALIFWKKKGLLSLEQESDGTIKTLHLLLPDHGSPAGHTESAAVTTEAAPAAAVAAADPPVPAPTFKMSAALLKDLSQNETARQLLFVAETYLGRPLTSKDIQTLLYCFHELHFSADLLEYLIEYCVSRQKTDASYMQKVAAGWYQDGITTVSAAKSDVRRYQLYYPVLNAFGIKNREPIRTEKQFIDCWTKDWGFDQDIIIEACERTMAKTHNPSFEYANSILSNWKKSSVKSKADIEKLDQSWKQNNETSQTGQPKKTAASKGKPAATRFNNFESREYDTGDLAKMLQQTLA
ncbi:MAG: DnaD domain protein [Lachnospiraceae bacterium]|nr:DnaD domain protein [Lachnospiraceae bacterium]MDY5742048.1 DnaD domain protein [Lachnospiraceae bacterium]